MGAYVPEGEHTIEFKYTAVHLVFAFVLVFFTFLMWIVYFTVGKKFLLLIKIKFISIKNKIHFNQK